MFGYENGQPFPIHISKETFEDQMKLLLITKDEKKHYVLIKDFNAFMYNESKHKERKHFCIYCLQCFSSERILANHVNDCLTINGTQAINMPKQGENILKFNNFHKQLPVPFVIYADFEAITKRYKVANKVKRWRRIRIGNHTLKPIRLMKIVAMDIRLYVATMTNIVNTLAFIEVKTLSTNLWKRCSKRLSNVKLSLRSISTNHWL